ncbi:hypothetical protein EDB81DRAFT_402792 [Dactylonectria macrodidyma]|uniref:Uncharacterized protein n=1 Tax=Dactylonectria macrodidyma TaxID=307937 RepID=A0A9P9J902_9HYPO|nr:hypothetical protein EDB81DRAFT_402792 [Dactylonectria macrodidyma]
MWEWWPPDIQLWYPRLQLILLALIPGQLCLPSFGHQDGAGLGKTWPTKTKRAPETKCPDPQRRWVWNPQPPGRLRGWKLRDTPGAF